MALQVGETLDWTTPGGHYSMRVQKVRPTVTTVTTYRGSLRVEDMCTGFAEHPTEGQGSDEKLARMVARAWAELLELEDPA